MSSRVREQMCNRAFNVTLCVLALVALGGCRRDENTLTMALALLPSELPVYRAVLGEFEHETGLRVVVVPQQYADIRRALAAEAFAERGTLDVVELDVYTLALAAPDVSALDDALLRPELQALAPAALQVGRINGLRFVPHRIAWQALVYNHVVLGKPPASWGELLAMARAHPAQIGFKAALYEGLTCDVLPFVWAAGGSGDVLDDAGARAAFQFFADLAPYLDPRSATFKESTVAEAMARGEVVLHLNWPFVMSLYASQGLAPATIRSAPLPIGPTGSRPATVLGGGYLAIPRSAPHRTGALRLVRYLIGKDVQQKLGRELGWFSARRDITTDAAGGLLAGFEAMRDDVRPRPERADYARLSRLWQQAFRAVVFEGADPAATLHAAQHELVAQRQGEWSAGKDRNARGEGKDEQFSFSVLLVSLAPFALCILWLRPRRQVLLVAPLLLYLASFLAYPSAYALKLAFTDALTGSFPSLVNFQLLWQDRLFWHALIGNLVLPILSVGVELVAGLVLAVLLAARFPGRRLMHAIVIIPFALPEIVFLTVMRYVFAPRGYANAALAATGVGPVEWLLPGRVTTFLTVVLVDAWHVTPVVFLMLLAALTSIPDEIGEAARLDGAGAVARFAFITVPLLRPALVAAVLLRGLDALRMFATPLVLGGVEGVPVLSTYAYHQWSDYGSDGVAAAAASLLALLSIALIVPLLRRRVPV